MTMTARRAVLLASLLVAAVSLSTAAFADIIYATSLEGSQIVKWDTTTNTVTTVYHTPTSADSLIFDTSGNIIYSAISAGQLHLYNPNTNADTVLASGLNSPADMVLEPGGNTVLVSEFGGGTIDRVSLTGGGILQRSTNYCNPEGMAYIGGSLYANIGCRDSGGPSKQLAQLDPTTLNVLHASVAMPEIDGLTYDSFSGKLFGSMLFGSATNEFDPTTLGVSFGFSTQCEPDGITSDGTGNIIVASRCTGQIQSFNLTTRTSQFSPVIFGLDDVAPASGLGSNPVPEPATFVLLGSALAPLVWRRRFRK